jgi:hypothetical protein
MRPPTPVPRSRTADGNPPAGTVRPRAGRVPCRMSVLPAATAPAAAAGAEHHAAATCASFGTPAEHAKTGALNLTLPIPYGRRATT